MSWSGFDEFLSHVTGRIVLWSGVFVVVLVSLGLLALAFTFFRWATGL